MNSDSGLDLCHDVFHYVFQLPVPCLSLPVPFSSLPAGYSPAPVPSCIDLSCSVSAGYPPALEGRADGRPARHRQDDAGQGGGHRVRHHLLQRLLLHAHLQVPRRVGETRQTALRNGERSAAAVVVASRLLVMVTDSGAGNGIHPEF